MYRRRIRNKGHTMLDIETLQKAMTGERGLDAYLRKLFITSLSEYPDLKVVGRKPLLTNDFYRAFITKHKFNESNDGRKCSKFFKRLQKLEIIHSRSASFPKKLSIVSINPNFRALHKVSLSHLDKFEDAKQNLLFSENLSGQERAYSFLRFFNPVPLYPNELKRIRANDIIFINNDAYIYLERDSIAVSKISSYRLIPVQDENIVSDLQRLCVTNEGGYIFESVKECEKAAQLFKKEELGSLSLVDIHMTGINTTLFKSSPLYTTLLHSGNAISPLTLAEMNALHPYCVPSNLMEKEKKRILRSLERPERDEDTKESESELFSIRQLPKLQKLLKTKSVSEFRRKIKGAKSELKKLIESDEATEHIQLICSYILYLLERFEKKEKMAASTVKGYVGLLEKHLFSKVEDLNAVETYEINDILSKLERLQYKRKSIRKTRALIHSFFSFHNKKHSLQIANISSYPKSLIFSQELDAILSYIDQSVTEEALRFGKRYKFKVLQSQTMILIGFYTGIRKNELRSRLLKDIYIYDNILYVDVNKEGLKKLGLNLKTTNAKRRIAAKIENEEHLSIIKRFLDVRSTIKNKSPFVFLRISEDNTIRSKAVDESVFDEITLILQSFTGRYVSFHSLRHSYATYEVFKTLRSPSSDPYRLLDLSLRMGHESPETTLKVYTHRSVLELGDV